MNGVYLLDASGLELPRTAAERLLSASEQARLAGFPSERRRREFLIGRLLLKSAFTGFSPVRAREFPSISPEIGANGKPSLPGIHFNLTHAGEVFILAIGKGAVGVDVEPVQHFDDETASFCFSQPQRKKISGSPHPERLATLLWCLREANGKLTGTGLLGRDEARGRIHRRGGFVTVGGTPHAWALASSAILSRKPWNESRSRIDAITRAIPC